MIAPATQKNSRRLWHVPPAIRRDETETLEGTHILEEVPNALGVYLWQRLHDLTLWSDAPPSTRGQLFTEEAGAHALLALRAPEAHDFPPDAAATLDQLLCHAKDVAPADVARAAETISEWAGARSARRTSLAYRQAAALATPADPDRALAMGRQAAAENQVRRAETWLWRTIGLARRARKRDPYAAAYVELGAMRERAGDMSGAQEMYLKASHAVARHSVHGPTRGAPELGMMRLALQRGDLDQAATHARRAKRWLGKEHPELLSLGAELAVYRGEGAALVPVFRELLTTAPEGSRRIHVLQLLCRAATQTGDRAVLEDVWPAAEELAREGKSAGTLGTGALLDLARTTASVGAVHRAEALVRVVIANSPSGDDRTNAEELLTQLFRP